MDTDVDADSETARKGLLIEIKAEKAPAWDTMRIGWPVVIQWLVSVVRSVFTFWMLGQYDDSTAMAAYGLANVLCNITGRTIVMGLGSGMDTFASQAWGAH